MPFKLGQQHSDEHRVHGFTIFRQIIPTPLLRDLRRVTVGFRDKANDLRHLKPLSRGVRDLGPWRDYENLAPLRDALASMLTPQHTHADLEGSSGLFFNPSEEVYAREWHRDWTDEFPGMPLAEWQRLCDDVRFFHQSNCPLYDDDATWIVPGSYLWLNSSAALSKVPFPVEPSSLNNLARERMYLNYCQAMPGAVQVHLNAGDFLLYRNTSWHLGVYLPYRTRATFFAYVDHPDWAMWRAQTNKQYHLGRERKPEIGTA